jgi:protein-serine/threonine kinase
MPFIFKMAFANALFNSRDRDEDLNDHIDSDTPRSGVATPQPDPSDKRLPGIMHNYFGQVGSGSSSSSRPNSDPLEIPAIGSEHENPSPFHHCEEMIEDYVLLSVAPDAQKKAANLSQNEDEEVPPLSPNERTGVSQASKISRLSGLHPYPTPPVSQTPSLHRLELSDASSEGDGSSVKNEVPSSSTHRKSISESIPSSVARRASLMNPLSSIVTTSSVHATHFSNPSDRYPATTPSTPVHSRLNSDFHESPSYDRLKKLTDDSARKTSIPATPTRALSNQTIKSDASGGSDRSHEKNGKTNDSESHSTTTSGPPAPAPKGKLTVKIAEARGLRKSKDPYVVAVFQRNELVSKGPRPEYGDEQEDSTAPQMGGIPIMRTGSDSGRPMAIPMKSRQSSNTSLSDYRDFKVKGRRSFTNPKWDTEAIL